MSDKRKKYYELYEDRYRQVYAQGVDYWTGNPEEIEAVFERLDEFFQYADIAPENSAIIEFGCGEGFVGEHLLQRGFEYRGIDLSASALQKAKARIPEKTECFEAGDITDLRSLPGESFDVALDNYCLHMLVIDEDRRRYLENVYRLLKVGGRAWFHEVGQEEKFTDTVLSFDVFLQKYPLDLDTCEKREAFTSGEKKMIRLPRVPARFNNGEGYREEIGQAGFRIEKILSDETGIVVYAKK